MVVVPCRLIDEERPVFLTLGREYEVLEIQCDAFRVLTDEDSIWPNDPVLYTPQCFTVVDAEEPPFWRELWADEIERYCSPKEWGRGFFEDYHDRVISVRMQFWRDLERLFPRTWAERRGSEPRRRVRVD